MTATRAAPQKKGRIAQALILPLSASMTHKVLAANTPKIAAGHSSAVNILCNSMGVSDRGGPTTENILRPARTQNSHALSSFPDVPATACQGFQPSMPAEKSVIAAILVGFKKMDPHSTNRPRNNQAGSCYASRDDLKRKQLPCLNRAALSTRGTGEAITKPPQAAVSRTMCRRSSSRQFAEH
jgi:hypothetical protein